MINKPVDIFWKTEDDEDYDQDVLFCAVCCEEMGESGPLVCDPCLDRVRRLVQAGYSIQKIACEKALLIPVIDSALEGEEFICIGGTAYPMALAGGEFYLIADGQ
jgi:hypothetical protein